MILKNKTYIIAEIAQAHDGSLGMVHSYIDALKHTGIDAIKFQMHFAEYESSKYEKFRINFSYQDSSRYDYWKRIEFTPEQWFEIKKHCDEVNIDFICSIFSDYSFNLLSSMNCKIIKIPSGEISNHLLLNKLKNTKKKLILSTGLSSYKEIQEALDILANIKKNIAILHCTSEYPTKPENIGLEQIAILKKKFKTTIGFSDHSGFIYSSLMAVSLGAEIIEAHAVFDKRMFGPDVSSSLTIDDFKLLADGVRFIENTKKNKINKNSLSQKTRKTKSIFGRSIIVNKDLKKGRFIDINDLSSIKPAGLGLSPKLYKKIINRKLKKDIKKNDFISLKDIY